MFLHVTEKRNKQLIEYAVTLHQTAVILPDTYVIDVDALVENATILKRTADKEHLELYYMTKQIGRNPYLARKIMEAGIEKAVVVDFKEALVLMEEGLPLGNVGHLVQIPIHLIERILRYGTDYVTVYSLEMLEKIDEVASKIGIVQPVLLRIVDDGDRIYEGQYGGFIFSQLETILPSLKQLTSVQIKGFTSFPCFLYDEEAKDFQATKNVETLIKAKAIFESFGFNISELNMPSATCERSIPFIKKIGGTQGEPGHALTGTTPMHAREDLAEKPAIVYVSEVSHTFKNKSYCYGGGYYRRGNLEHAKVVDKKQHNRYTTVSRLDNESIDYYLELKTKESVGSTVVMAFRTQIFVTRSFVALVEGLSIGKPKLVGIYDSFGKKI